jgi:aspartyl-tRNA(Asn)/glutamyl-tRNA(Gln) amidotransferase subunit A
MSELVTLTLKDVRDRLARKDVSAREVVDACIERIEATDPSLNALTRPMPEEARARADALDAAGPDPNKPLWGVPVAIKDLICVAGVPNTCGSRILENFTPFYDAHLVSRLVDAGAVVVGKANLDEFAMGSSNESSHFGPVRNPWDPERVPGGSSGGSAASVSARQCFAAVGTDTGGSIRLPASLCGCVGMKPTYGRVSRYGLVAYGSSLDQAGPFARTVEDAALMLESMAGHDSKDSTSVDRPVEPYAELLAERGDLKGITVGLPAEYWREGLDPEVEKTLSKSLDTLESLGATLTEVSLPLTKYAVPTYYIIAMAEASSNLARFDGVRYGRRTEKPEDLLDLYVRSRTEGFGDEVQRRIMVGTYVLSAGYYDAYYKKAAQVRRRIRDDFLAALDGCDVLAGATSPTVAWPLGALTDDPVKMYLMDIFTLSINLAGLPGLVLPAGVGAESGMPVGLQLIGKAFDEATLFRTGHVLEQALDPIGPPAGLPG